MHSWCLEPDIYNAKNVGINNIIYQFSPSSLQDLYKWIFTQGEVTLGVISTYLNQDEGEAGIMVDLYFERSAISFQLSVKDLPIMAHSFLKAQIMTF